MLEGKKEAQLHKLTPLLWDDVLPSRTEVLSQSMHCAKCLPRTNPPTAPTPMNARVQGIVFWRYRPEQVGGGKKGCNGMPQVDWKRVSDQTSV